MTSQKIDIELIHAPQKSGAPIVALVKMLDSSLMGHNASFRVELRAIVHDKRAVNRSKELFRKDFQFQSPVERIEIPREKFQVYSYTGQMVDLELHLKVIVDDGWVVDTTVSEETELSLGIKPSVNSDAKEIIDPKDTFCFVKNLKAIPAQNQLITLGLCFVGLIVVIINTVIGAHDQMVPEAQTYLYSHVDSDGDGQSPLLNSLMGSGAFGFAIWLAIRAQLRKYMDFFLVGVPQEIARDARIDIPVFLSGSSRVPLHDVTLRFVACNMEKGQYIRGSGSNQRTVSFSEPARALVLYEKRVDHIPAKREITDYFAESFPLTPMYDVLYPPCMVSDSHGISVYWEVQFIHDEFVDQELPCPVDRFRFSDFLIQSKNLTDKLFR